MLDPFETKKRTDGELEFVIEKYCDYDYDISHLGEYTDRAPNAWYVDRTDGTLRGDDPPEPQVEDFFHDVDNPTPEEEIEFDDAWDSWDEGGPEVLARWLPTQNSRKEYKYWKPAREWCGMAKHYAEENNPREHFDKHVAPKLKKYDITSPDTDDPEALGKAAEALYACQDYEQVSGLSRGDWSYVWIRVSMKLDGQEIAWAGLGGITYGFYTEAWTAEREESYIEEVVADLIRQCKAASTTYAGRTRVTLEKLERIITGWDTTTTQL
jgi:hypothetical protein